MEKQDGTHVSNLFSLNNRVALITGAAGHLGTAMTEALCEAGATVILNGRDAGKLNSFAKELEKKGHDVLPIAADITTNAGRKCIVDAIKKYSCLHVLVNNAYQPSAGTMETSSEDDFRKAYEISVVAAFSLMKSLKPLLQKGAQAAGTASSVINISSMYGFVSPDLRIYGGKGHENPPYYGAAKAGLFQLTRYAACEWGRESIRVNTISPGPFPQPQVLEKFPGLFKKLCDKNPMGRTGIPWELKGAVVFLASPASSYVTGANIPVDGGWTAW